MLSQNNFTINLQLLKCMVDLNLVVKVLFTL